MYTCREIKPQAEGWEEGWRFEILDDRGQHVIRLTKFRLVENVLAKLNDILPIEAEPNMNLPD